MTTHPEVTSKSRPRYRSKIKRPAEHHKLAALPKNARVTKRPLFHAPVPSPHAGPSQPKVVYISTRTPFLAAVKRVERLLRLAEKRLVQSVTAQTRNPHRAYSSHGDGHQDKKSANGGKPGGGGGSGRGDGGVGGRRVGRPRNQDEDEIAVIAEEVERRKTASAKISQSVHSANGGSLNTDEHFRTTTGDDTAIEHVLIKGSGKAIAKVLDLGLWFQERADVYKSVIRTATVTAIDDVEIPEDSEMTVEQEQEREKEREKNDDDGEVETDVPEARMRNANVVEIAVSLR